jgi:peptide/nickel transport system ATP-binding protein
VTATAVPIAGAAVEPLVEADGLSTTFHTGRGPLRAVDGVSLAVGRGERIGIVGESGSGKSVLARTMLGLVDGPQSTAVVEGTSRFEGVDLLSLPEKRRRPYRGRSLAMVFQDPMTALNPVKKVGAHLTEHVRLHLAVGRGEAHELAARSLDDVGIPDVERCLAQYPHELSGGMRQRACIALALICEPKLLVADEPTTALDVTVQRQILDLLDRATAQRAMSTVLITHDLAIVAQRTSRVLVMYGGRVVEEVPSERLLPDHAHPYTAALLRARPRLSLAPHSRLEAIEGRPPDLVGERVGCSFAPRCRRATARCAVEEPALRATPGRPDQQVACHDPLAPGEEPG